MNESEGLPPVIVRVELSYRLADGREYAIHRDVRYLNELPDTHALLANAVLSRVMDELTALNKVTA